MLHFEGDRDFTQAPSDVWAKLSDARFLVRCLPDVESVAQAEAGHAVCTVRPGLAFVRGSLEVTLRVLEAIAPSLVRLDIRSKGIGSESHVEAALRLVGHEGGTRIHWAAEVKSLGGLLKAMPQGLIRG